MSDKFWRLRVLKSIATEYLAGNLKEGAFRTLCGQLQIDPRLFLVPELAHTVLGVLGQDSDPKQKRNVLRLVKAGHWGGSHGKQ